MHEDDLPAQDGLQYKICENQVKIKGISSGDQADQWLKDYGKSRNIVWRVLRTFPQASEGKGRVFSYKKEFRCQHDTKYRSQRYENAKPRKHTSKNTDCPAKARIAIRRMPQSKRRLKYSETSIFDFGCTVTFIKSHNHGTASSLRKTARNRKAKSVTSQNDISGDDHMVDVVVEQHQQQRVIVEKDQCSDLNQLILVEHNQSNSDLNNLVYSTLDKSASSSLMMPSSSSSHYDGEVEVKTVVSLDTTTTCIDQLPADESEQIMSDSCVYLVVTSEDISSAAQSGSSSYLQDKEAKLMHVFDRIRRELRHDPNDVGPAIDKFCRNIETHVTSTADLVTGLSIAFQPASS